MVIKIQDCPDPLSPESYSKSSILAESQAYHLLARELERYTTGEVIGRSFLISGHRGSGKTTLVHKAIQDVRPRPGSLIPLLVPLHGPALLKSDAVTRVSDRGDKGAEDKMKQATGTTPPAGAQPANPAKPEPFDPTLQFLQQITICLYRALAKELTRSFGKRLAARRRQWILPTKLFGRDFSPEVVGELVLELDDAPDFHVLRKLWKKAGFHKHGVLFEGYNLRARKDPDGRNTSQDQGVRELVALSTAAQAYRKVSGEYEKSEVGKSTDEKEISTEVKLGVQAKELKNLILTLVSGGAVGAAYFMAEFSVLVAGITAVIASLSMNAGLNLTRSEKKTKSFTKEHSFIRDTSVATLDRELPILVERIREAGLAPIFVVDELDKIRPLADPMKILVQNLKHIVTERAFFCFLTDRDYFEHLKDMARRTPYPREHTYFSHRLFVLYRPRDLHKYLDRLLVTHGAGRGTDEASDQADLATTSYLILQRAMLHVFDLRRELSKICDSDGQITLGPGETRTNLGYRLTIMMQLALELVLEGDALRDRLDQDPHFGQLAYDTLYYISRKWEESQEQLDLSDGAITNYLGTRMRLDSEGIAMRGDSETDKQDGEGAWDNPDNGATTAEKSGSGSQTRLPLSNIDLDFLFDEVRTLAALLAEPKKLVVELQATSKLVIPSAVIQAIPKDVRLLTPAGEHLYAWQYDRYGRQIGGAQAPTGSLDEIEPDLKFIASFKKFLDKVTGGGLAPDTLAMELGILNTTPDWRAVEAAIARVQLFQETGQAHSELDHDKVSIAEYVGMIESRSAILEGILAVGTNIGRAANATTPEQRLVTGMRTLSEMMGAGSVPANEFDKRLQKIFATEAHEISGPSLTRETIDIWTIRIAAMLSDPPDKLSVTELKDISEISWRQWLDRMMRFANNDKNVFDPNLPDLYCRAANVNPSRILHEEPSQISLTNWMNIFLSAQEHQEQDEFSYIPEWFSVFALVVFGLHDRIERIGGSGTILSNLSRLIDTDQIHKDILESVTRMLDIYRGRQRRARDPRMGLLIAKAKSSAIEEWLPGTRHGGIVLRHAQLDAFTKVLGVKYPRGVKLDDVFDAVMIEAGTGKVAHTVRSKLPRSLSKLPLSYIVSGSAGERPDDGPGIHEPVDFDDAMDQAMDAATLFAS